MNLQKIKKNIVKYYRENKLVINGTIGGLIIIALGYTLPYTSRLTESATLSENLANIQVFLTAVGFLVIFITLLITISHFRKIMAKPKLEVIFTETGDSRFSIIINQQSDAKHLLKLSIINRGNDITKLFQIDYQLPIIFYPKLGPTQGLVPNIAHAGSASNPVNNQDGTCTISYFSDEKVYCFVNRPSHIFMLTLETRASSYSSYPNEFEIIYKIFGDWKEPQEGKLKVLVNKQGGS